MAINFVTGLPRHGKTLWTLVTVKARSESENRAVYYCNIPDVRIPGWTEIKHPDEWLSLPDGALIVIDELQDFWPKNQVGARLPPPIVELSKHGKRGFDFYFITQEPNLVHSTPRDLCQHHYYVVRAAGTHNATVRKFDRICLHPDKEKRKAIQTDLWHYPAEAFTWYKSADMHNVKRQIPRNLKLIPVVLLVLLAAVAGAFYSFQSFMSKAAGQKEKPATTTNQVGGKVAAAPGAPASRPVVMTQADYLDSLKPRIEGLPHTAPRYDALTTAKTAPYPAACVRMGERCKCYTEQATPLPTSIEICQAIVENGYYMDWQPPEGRGSAGGGGRREPGQKLAGGGSNWPDMQSERETPAQIAERRKADNSVWDMMRDQRPASTQPKFIGRV